MPKSRGSSATGRWLTGCGNYAPLLAAMVFFAAMLWPFMRKGDEGEWRRCFLRAAHRLQAREIIHRPDEPNTYAYPPAMAMLAVPLANLPFRWSLTAWYAVNVAAMVAAITCAWRLTGGPSICGARRPWPQAFWLGLLLASRFLIAPLENQQFDVVIAACLFGGCLALWRGRDLPAAILLGSAAAMKCTPLLFAPYLVWRGKTRSAIILVFVAVLLNRAPDFFWPRADGGSYLGDWAGTFLIKVGRAAPGVWDSDLILNQSLAGLVNRLVQSGVPLAGAQIPSALAPLSPAASNTIRVLVYALSVALLLLTAWAFGRPGKASPVVLGNVGEAAWADVQTGLEASALVCLMLLFSPMSSKAHYVVLVLPCLLLSRAVVEDRLAWKAWLPPLMALGPLTAKGLTGKPLGDLMLAWGLPTWFAFLLLVAMWRLRCFTGAPALGILRPCALLGGSLMTHGADTDGATLDERNDDLSLVV
jgi:hypothetical protein